jgi:hypothetical protein
MRFTDALLCLYAVSCCSSLELGCAGVVTCLCAAGGSNDLFCVHRHCTA